MALSACHVRGRSMARKRKHKYGSGSIYRHPDGRWRATFPYPPGSGKRKVVYAKTRGEVVEKMNAVLATPYVEPPKVKAPVWTVGSWLSYWLESIYKPSVGITTYEQTAIIVRVHLSDLAAIPLSELTPMHVQDLISQRIKEKYATSTIGTILDRLNRALGDAVRL